MGKLPMAPSKVPTRAWHALPLAKLSKAHPPKPAEVINCLKPRKSAHPAGFGHQLAMSRDVTHSMKDSGLSGMNILSLLTALLTMVEGQCQITGSMAGRWGSQEDL